jgi:hypothetical protein
MRDRAAAIRQAAGLFVVLLIAGRADAQDLGHKTLGTVGLRAGTQTPTGIYLVDRLFLYTASEATDRNGNRIPINLQATAVVEAIGFSGSYELPRLHTYVNASFGVPVTRATLNTDDPRVSLDKLGLSDLYVQPLELGWRLRHLDLVTGYDFYIPTRSFTPGQGSGVSRAQFSHEFSLGGTIYFDATRTFYLTALISYELNQRKLGIDITRGDTIQLQGGAGIHQFRILDFGVVGYGLWQVRDDRGADLPPVLRGARDRAYSVGGEVGVTMPEVRSRLVFRYTHELASVSRTQGQLVLVELTFTPWSRNR